MDFINNIEISIPEYSFIVNRINKKKFVIVEKQSAFKFNNCNNKAICKLYSTLTIRNHKTTSFMLIWGLRCQFWTDFTGCFVFSLETLNKYFSARKCYVFSSCRKQLIWTGIDFKSTDWLLYAEAAIGCALWRKDLFKNLANFTEKDLGRGLFLIKFQAWNLLKRLNIGF